MLHDIRKNPRYSLRGTAILCSDDETIVGRVVDISRGGLALAVDQGSPGAGGWRRTWLCRIQAEDLPDTLVLLVRMVRASAWQHGYGLACAISAINRRDVVLLSAYRALALARGNPRSAPAGRLAA